MAAFKTGGPKESGWMPKASWLSRIGLARFRPILRGRKSSENTAFSPVFGTSIFWRNFYPVSATFQGDFSCSWKTFRAVLQLLKIHFQRGKIFFTCTGHLAARYSIFFADFRAFLRVFATFQPRKAPKAAKSGKPRNLSAICRIEITLLFSVAHNTTRNNSVIFCSVMRNTA